MKFYRYSTIHHDVRDYFDLSIFEYLVCDSYHQLSHQQPTVKTCQEIGEFIGIDRSTVSKCRDRLINKGLLKKQDDGYKTTELWSSVVTYAQGGERDKITPKRDNITQNVIKSRDTYNNNIKNNNGDADASRKDKLKEVLSSVGLTVTNLTDSGEPIKPRTSTAQTPDAPKVYAVFKETIGVSNPMWQKNKTERTAAQTLFQTKGLDKVKKVLEFWSIHNSDPFCPDVTTPYKLASKWEAMILYRNKNGL